MSRFGELIGGNAPAPKPVVEEAPTPAPVPEPVIEPPAPKPEPLSPPAPYKSHKKALRRSGK